jgi:citrate synthase
MQLSNYGELGGDDEYELVELLKTKKITKQVICYIAGTVSELFETPPQFGHAKAMAKSKGESAREKRDALKKAGALVAESFSEFVTFISKIKVAQEEERADYAEKISDIKDRKHALITSSVSHDEHGDVKILHEDLLNFAAKHSIAYNVASLFLGKHIKSKELEEFVELVLKLAVDHGPYVSGAVNTIITARAGKDLVSSLAAGLLTIGPRFGGAINQAAANWLQGIHAGKSAYEFVEDFASKKIYIPGIGHRKYRVDFPDPRVGALLNHADSLTNKRFTEFALDVQKVTTAKKGNLILNVDGAIAAVLLDILSEKEGYTDEELHQLTEIEFFNALFVYSRAAGFIAHFLDQKRLDEGMFRLTDDLVADVDINQ